MKWIIGYDPIFLEDAKIPLKTMQYKHRTEVVECSRTCSAELMMQDTNTDKEYMKNPFKAIYYIMPFIIKKKSERLAGLIKCDLFLTYCGDYLNIDRFQLLSAS